MKRSFLKVFIALSLLFGAIYGAGKVIAMRTSKERLESHLSQQTGADIDIRGKIDFKVFPLPHLEITHIRVSNLKRGIMNVSIRSPQTAMHPDLLSVVSGKPRLKKLTFTQAQLNIELTGIIKEGSKKSNIVTDNVSFTDTTLIISNTQYNMEKKFKNLNLNIMQENGEFDLDGSFKSNLNEYYFVSKLKRNQDQTLKIVANLDSALNKFNFEGVFDSKNFNFEGKSKINGKNLQEFLFKYAYRSEIFFPDGRNFDYALEFDFNLNDEGINSDNIIITSPAVNSTGSFQLNKYGMGQLNLSINDIQIDDLITEEDKTRVTQELIKLGADDQIYFKMPASGLFEINLNAHNFNLYKHSLSNFTAKFTLDGKSQDRLFNMEFLHSGKNNVNINGAIIHNLEESIKLVGDVRSNGTDIISLADSFGIKIQPFNKEKLNYYELSSKFELAKNLYKFTHIESKIDDISMSGKININNNADSKLSNIDLVFDNINFDDYFLIDYDENKRHLFDYAFGLLAKDYDNRSLFQKFLWLRNVNSNIKYNIAIENFISNNIADKNLSLSGTIDHRYFAIDDLGIRSDKNSFSSKFIIDINDTSPKVDFSLEAYLLDATFLGYDKADNKWSTAYFRIPDFTNLPATVTMNLDRFIYKELNLSKVKVNANVLDGVVYFDNFHGNVFDNGEFNITGNYITTGVPTLSLAFTASNLKTENLSQFLLGTSTIDTSANMTGTINSFGQNIDMFMHKLRADIRMVTNAVTLKNYNIRNLIQYIADLSNFEENLPEYDINRILRKGDVTFSPIDLNLNIRNGVFKIDNLSLNSSSVKSVYSGLIHLPEQTLIMQNVNIFRSFYRSGDEVKEQMLRFDREYNGNLFDFNTKLDDTQVKNFVLNIKKHVNEILEMRDNIKNKEQETKKN